MKKLFEEDPDKVLRRTIESQTRIIDRQSRALLEACKLVEAYKGCPEGKWREACVEVNESSVCADCWVEEFLRVATGAAKTGGGCDGDCACEATCPECGKCYPKAWEEGGVCDNDWHRLHPQDAEEEN
jgi:hypothetical protein